MTFCGLWILWEWVSSWIFTGFPWNMIGYSLCFSEELIQSTSIFGILGLSLITIYIGSSFYSKRMLKTRMIFSFVLIASVFLFGAIRLYQNEVNLSKVKVRIV